MSDTLISSRDAARLWGCTDRGFSSRMRQYGVEPVVLPATARQGGRSNWWHPADVLRVRKLARAAEAKAAAEQAANAPPLPTDRQERAERALRRMLAVERWRSYYQRKAEARGRR